MSQAAALKTDLLSAAEEIQIQQAQTPGLGVCTAQTPRWISKLSVAAFTQVRHHAASGYQTPLGVGWRLAKLEWLQPPAKVPSPELLPALLPGKQSTAGGSKAEGVWGGS